jgi:hypothetical protein
MSLVFSILFLQKSPYSLSGDGYKTLPNPVEYLFALGSFVFFAYVVLSGFTTFRKLFGRRRSPKTIDAGIVKDNSTNARAR